MLAAKAPRGEVAAVLAEAFALADGMGAVPLAASIEELARIARLDLRSDRSESATPSTGEATRPGDGQGPTDPFGLTTREREVLVLVAAGQTNRRIADSLFISESTASVHVSNILGKLGVSNRVEAAAVAVRLGLAG
jgi:DNA-binding NarL/FixJ family response regulator